MSGGVSIPGPPGSCPPAISLLDTGRADAVTRGRIQAEAWGEEAAALFGVRWALTRQLGRITEPRALRDLAQAHVEALTAWDADLAAEMAALAEGSGLELWQLVILNHYTDFRDIGPEALGCSALYAPLPTGPICAQTWDMHGTAEPFVRLLRVAPGPTETWPAAVLFTLTGCLGMAGLNAAGVAVCINNLTPDDARVGILWPAVVRRMLQARSADEAAALLDASPLASGHNYLIADATTVLDVETTARRKVVTHEGRGPGGAWFWHTNHYLSPALQPHELPLAPASTSCDRYAFLARHLGAPETRPTSPEAIATLLGDHEGYPRSLCTHLHLEDPAGVRTCGGVVFDLKNRRLLAARGCLNGAAWQEVWPETGGEP